MIKQPILTEKSFINAGLGIYTFSTTRQTTKHEVKALIESFYKVHVVKVTSTVKKGKLARTGKRRVPHEVAPQKTVRVWLKKGESITLFETKKD